MANKIGWTDRTWNPITGCDPVSEACERCYAKRMATRLAGRYGYPADEPFRVTLHPDKLDEPLKWKKPQRIFVCSMSDFFHPAIPLSFQAHMLSVMAECPQHTFMVLTKRPELAAELDYIGGIELPNVWYGATIENQKRADERREWLLSLPGPVRFVSVEPMLGPVNLEAYFADYDQHGEPSSPKCNPDGSSALGWVICGAESGPGARPIRPEWVRSLRDQCVEAGVPFWFKGWGASYKNLGPMVAHCQPEGQTLDGQLWHERP